MIRSSPSSSRVSLASARRLFLLSALALALSKPFATFFLTWERYCSSTSRSTRSYQTSTLLSAASRRISSRYALATLATTSRRSLFLNPRSRPATAKLAASRFTSHSNGPGKVSSKSLMSKISRRSGAAKTPKLERWASPQS